VLYLRIDEILLVIRDKRCTGFKMCGGLSRPSWHHGGVVHKKWYP